MLWTQFAGRDEVVFFSPLNTLFMGAEHAIDPLPISPLLEYPSHYSFTEMH